MWSQYFGTLLHFSLSIGMAAVLVACAWLYWDGYKVSYRKKELIRVFGFLILAVSFVFVGVEVQGVGWSATSWAVWVPMITLYARIAGYTLVLVSLVLEPLQPMPYASAMLFSLSDSRFVAPVVAALVGFLYIRRATVGLENHVKRPAYAFGLLSLFEISQLARMWYETVDIRIWSWILPFGTLWWAGRVMLVMSLFILGRWVFGYLLKQFTIQLFIIFAFLFLGTFLLVTAGYTGLLLAELRQEAGNQVKMSVNVLKYAMGEQQERLLSEAKLLAGQTKVGEAVETALVPELGALMTEAIRGKRISQAVAVDKTGNVIWRSDQPDRTGEIWSDQLTINKIVRGDYAKTIVGNSSGGISEMGLMAAAPVYSGDKVIGGIIMGLTIDPLLLSGIKSATGLEAAVFNQNQLVATSIEVAGGSAPIGVEEKRNPITDRVMKEGLPFQGAVDFLSVPYIAVFEPLKDGDNGVVGMLFGGRPETEVMATAARSLEFTFYGTVILMILGMFPAWIIARNIAKQAR